MHTILLPRPGAAPIPQEPPAFLVLMQVNFAVRIHEDRMPAVALPCGGRARPVHQHPFVEVERSDQPSQLRHMSIGKSVRPDNAGQLGLEDATFLDLTLLSSQRDIDYPLMRIRGCPPRRCPTESNSGS